MFFEPTPPTCLFKIFLLLFLESESGVPSFLDEPAYDFGLGLFSPDWAHL